VLSTAGKPFVDAGDVGQSIFQELRDVVGASRRTQNDNLTLVDFQQDLQAFVESKRGWMSRGLLANDENLREKSTAVRHLWLTSDQHAWTNSADLLAPALITRYDGKHEAHCGARCDSHDALSTHRLSCVFRPAPCPHAGCLEVMTAGALDAHDAVCLFKAVPCNFSVPVQVFISAFTSCLCT
jgi:hypothetical protein